MAALHTQKAVLTVSDVYPSVSLFASVIMLLVHSYNSYRPISLLAAFPLRTVSLSQTTLTIQAKRFFPFFFVAYLHFHHLPPSRIIKSVHMTHNGYSLAYFYRNICLLCRHIAFGNVSRVVVLLETRKSDLLTLQHSEPSRDVFSPASI